MFVLRKAGKSINSNCGIIALAVGTTGTRQTSSISSALYSLSHFLLAAQTTYAHIHFYVWICVCVNFLAAYFLVFLVPFFYYIYSKCQAILWIFCDHPLSFTITRVLHSHKGLLVLIDKMIWLNILRRKQWSILWEIKLIFLIITTKSENLENRSFIILVSWNVFWQKLTFGVSQKNSEVTVTYSL